MIVQGELGLRPAGPEIRGREIARAFAERSQVVLAASVTHPVERDGMRVVPRSRASLLAEVTRHDIVIAPLLPPYLMAAMAMRRTVGVADLYDPVDLEIGTLARDRRTERTLAMQRAIRRFQLRWSDVVVCANDRQRRRTVAELEGLGRSDRGPLLVTVPMGVPEPPTPADDHPLRRHFGLAIGDPLVLWWGSVWRWLDATTAIRAIQLLTDRRPDIRFVITAGRPSAHTDVLNATEQAREVARDLGLLGRNVLFFEDWVPYEERHRYLADADLGLTLHNAGPESSFAARARYTDYLWASLPSVLAEGDEAAREMAASGAAWLVAPHDPVATARAIDLALRDREGLARARDACRTMALRYRWSTITQPLVQQVETLAPNGRSPRRAIGIVSDSARFYGNRLVDSCLGTA